MAPKLPNHLASLLRHQPAASPVGASAAETSQGKAARKKAARVKRRAKAKEDRAADRAERVEKKKQLQEVEVKADPQESTIPKKKKLVPKKKRAAIAKREGGEQKAGKPNGPKGPKASAASEASPFDRAAAADDALLLDLEKKLGIAGDSKRRRKEEKQIFADLFEGEDLGIEQLPSSDEDETKAGLEALKDEDMVGLLDSILGGKTASKGPIKAKVSKKKSKTK